MLDSLLAGLGGAGNGLLSLLGLGQVNAQAAQPSQQPQMGPGFGDRLMAGAQGALNSSSPMGAIGNLLGGLTTGSRTDPAGVQAKAIQGMLGQLVARGQIDPTTAQFLAANPKAWEELSKAMINVPMQIAPDGSIIQSRPFGQLGIPGGVPVSERTDVTNPDGSRSPAFAIKPSLQNPQGRIAVPGAPQVAPPAMQPGQPALNPNLPNGGRPIISQASPRATKEQEGQGEVLAGEYKTITNNAAAATRKLSSLQRLTQLSPTAFEGAMAPLIGTLRSALTSLGLPAGEKLPATEAFNSLTNKLVLDANNGSLGAGVSNADVEFLKNMQPASFQTKDGRKMIIDMHVKLAQRDQEVAKMAQQYRAQNNGSLDGFQVFIQEWANRPENHLFRGMEAPRANLNDRFSAVGDNPRTAVAPPPPPKVGFRKGGFEFIGGDPAKPESWRKLDLQ